MAAGQDALTELTKVSFGMLGTNMQAGEMMVASGSVIGARMALMCNAAVSPATGDYDEIGGMMQEKMVAFSQVGHAFFDQWSAMMIDTTKQVQESSNLAFGGRPLTGQDIQTLTEGWLAHGTRMLAMSMETGGLAMAPLHQHSTENALRLG